VPEKPQSERLHLFGDWQAARDAPDCVICSVPGVRNPYNFPQTPGVEGIEVLCQGLADGPCLAPIEQDWEDVGSIEVHLSVCEYVGPPDVLLEEGEAFSCDRDASQNFGLTSSIV